MGDSSDIHTEDMSIKFRRKPSLQWHLSLRLYQTFGHAFEGLSSLFTGTGYLRLHHSRHREKMPRSDNQSRMHKGPGQVRDGLPISQIEHRCQAEKGVKQGVVKTEFTLRRPHSTIGAAGRNDPFQLGKRRKCNTTPTRS